MNYGWLRLHRELMDKPIWTEATPEQKVVQMTILMMANHSEKQWEWKGKPYEARPGQFVTSLPSLAQKCGKNISIQKIRTSLKRLERYGFLTDEPTRQNRLITINNWGIYQGFEYESTDELTDTQQTPNRQLTPNKNVKNVKNEKKSNSRKEVYDEDSPPYILAQYFFKQIQKNNANHKEPNFQNWSDDIRKMIELDKRDKREIGQLMQWVQQDNFEMANVLSPSKLRSRYDALVIKMNQSKKKGQVVVVPTDPAKEFELDLSKGEDE